MTRSIREIPRGAGGNPWDNVPNQFGKYADYTQYAINKMILNDYPDPISGYQGYKWNIAGHAWKISSIDHLCIVVGPNCTSNVNSSSFPYYLEIYRHNSNVNWGAVNNQFYSPGLLPVEAGGANYLYTDGHVDYEPGNQTWLRTQFWNANPYADQHFAPWPNGY